MTATGTGIAPTGRRAFFEGDLAAPDQIPEAGIEAATQMMRDGRLFRYGESRDTLPEAALLEEEFAAYMGRRFCVAVNSGGCALFIALRSLGLGHGDRVLVNAFTLAPVPGAIAHAGATPILVDINQRYTIDTADLDKKAAESGARCVVLSYMRGHIPDMHEVMDICQSRGLLVVEDCAHTLGASWAGRLSGTFGDVGCFSTQAFKHMNSGEGGLLVTDDEDVAARAILLSGSYMFYSQHRARPALEIFERHRYTTPNCSMRMSGLAAAILRPQLALLPQRNERWRAIYAALAPAVAAIDHIEVPSRPKQEEFVPSSLQFSLVGLTPGQITRFLAAANTHGVHLKFFGEAEAVGFTSRHDHWRYLDQTDQVPAANRILRCLCDVRLPLGLSTVDCLTIATVLREAMAEATR